MPKKIGHSAFQVARLTAGEELGSVQVLELDAKGHLSAAPQGVGSVGGGCSWKSDVSGQLGGGN